MLIFNHSIDNIVAYRRDHRFQRYSTSGPSKAYKSLIGLYSQNSNFGQLVQHVNSDKSITPQIIMNNNHCIPWIGFGTWQLGNNTNTIKNIIRQAIDAGYRLIDTAYIYNTEEGIGLALKDAFASGKLKRDDVFITTKVWLNHFSKPKVLQSIRDSLRKLKLNQVDLVLMHYPTGFKDGPDNYPKYPNGTIIPRTWQKDAYLETWQAMEDAHKLGLTRSIGVSNFNQEQIWKLLLNARIKPVINQVSSINI